jgi:hypothetical protein
MYQPRAVSLAERVWKIVFRLKLFKALHLIAFQANIFSPPLLIGYFRNTYRFNSLGHRPTLCCENVNLSKLGD